MLDVVFFLGLSVPQAFVMDSLQGFLLASCRKLFCSSRHGAFSCGELPPHQWILWGLCCMWEGTRLNTGSPWAHSLPAEAKIPLWLSFPYGRSWLEPDRMRVGHQPCRKGSMVWEVHLLFLIFSIKPQINPQWGTDSWHSWSPHLSLLLSMLPLPVIPVLSRFSDFPWVQHIHAGCAKDFTATLKLDVPVSLKRHPVKCEVARNAGTRGGIL